MRLAILFIIAFLFVCSIFGFSQQTNTTKPLGYCSYNQQVRFNADAKENLQKLKEIKAVLKGGIWDDVLPNMVYVPMAKFIRDFYIDMTENPNGKNYWTTTFNGDFILNTEVTNKMYRYFLADSTDEKFKPHFGKDSAIANMDLKQYFHVKEKGKTYTIAYYDLLDDYPVVGITWNAAKSFCTWLSKKAYPILKNSGFKEVLGINLPTQAFFDGSNIMNLMDDNFTIDELRAKYINRFFSGEVKKVNYGEMWDSIGHSARKATDDGFYFTNPVKQFKPGNLGLYGMQGNAAEWILDMYDADKYEPHPSTMGKEKLEEFIKKNEALVRNPQNYRVVLGGSWYDSPFYLQPGVKQKLMQEQSSERVGFRLTMDFFPLLK